MRRPGLIQTVFINISYSKGGAFISALGEPRIPAYFPKNGEGDLVVMNIEAFERREQILELRAKVLQAEQERIEGAATVSVSEARNRLRERINEL